MSHFICMLSNKWYWGITIFLKYIITILQNMANLQLIRTPFFKSLHCNMGVCYDYCLRIVLRFKPWQDLTHSNSLSSIIEFVFDNQIVLPLRNFCIISRYQTSREMFSINKNRCIYIYFYITAPRRFLSMITKLLINIPASHHLHTTFLHFLPICQYLNALIHSYSRSHHYIILDSLISPKSKTSEDHDKFQINIRNSAKFVN